MKRYIGIAAIVIATGLVMLGASFLIVSTGVDAAGPWEGNITINADGSFSPSNAPVKVFSNNMIYRLTDDVKGYIFVYRDGITLDGDGYTLFGEGDWYWPMSIGIFLDDVDHCTVKELTIDDHYGWGIVIKGDHNTIFKCHFDLNDDWWESSGIEVHGNYNVIKKCSFIGPESWMGVTLADGEFNTVLNCEFDMVSEAITSVSSNNYIIANEMTDGWGGIFIYWDQTGCIIKSNKISYFSGQGIWLNFDSYDNLVMENKIYYNKVGIKFQRSNENTVCCNNIRYNDVAFNFRYGSSDNILHHNNIIGNTGIFNTGSSAADNTWDDGYGEGNYWSDYEGEDTNHDGVGDTNLPHNGVDYYPLMNEV
ncbi:MAG: nitrous oxide reductase family maturation protein NosD [Thermoplasmatota archaeon]